MPKQSEASLTGLLEIPLITSRTGPMKRFVADLGHIAEQLDRARNAMVRAWLRWREDHPKWIAPLVMNEDGTPKLTKKGDTIPLSPMHPQHVDSEGEPCSKEDGGKGFETYLYHVGRKASPDVAAILISTASREVMSNLTTDIQHHHTVHKFRWQAILANDEQAPTFRARTIPVPNNSSVFCYAGRSAGGKSASKADRKTVEFWGKSSAVMLFPLFAGSSGRAVRCPVATVNVGALSPGNRDVLKKIAAGEFKFADSKLLYKKERWQVQLTYQRPREDLGLDKKRIAIIYPQFAEASHPFLIDSEQAQKKWFCGHGKWLAAEFERLNDRRLKIRRCYEVATSGVKGHGRKRFEVRLKPWARKTHNCQRHFVWQLIAEIVRFCKRFNCGSVVYREPTLGIREHLWLGKREVPFDWTTLLTDLQFKLKFLGIECTVERIHGKDLRERFGGDKKPAIAHNGQEPVAATVATNGANRSRFRKGRKKEPLANGDGKHGR